MKVDVARPSGFSCGDGGNFSGDESSGTRIETVREHPVQPLIGNQRELR